MRLIALLSFLVIQFSGCTNDEEIVFGVYCGECIGNCATMIRVDATGAYIDSTSYFDQVLNGQVYEFRGTKLPGSVYEKIKHMPSAVPKDLWMEDKRIGEPDARDQCGYYIEAGGNHWHIDPDKHPGYLDEFLKEIDSALGIANGITP
jgi:hypothetical protein